MAFRRIEYGQDCCWSSWRRCIVEKAASSVVICASLRAAVPSDAKHVADVLLASRKAFLQFATPAHTDEEVRAFRSTRRI